MAYTWIEKTIDKYGQEATQNLIRQQQEYENKYHNNDCEHCGKHNEGSIVDCGKPVLIHYGLWSNGKCNFCGKLEN